MNVGQTVVGCAARDGEPNGPGGSGPSQRSSGRSTPTSTARNSRPVDPEEIGRYLLDLLEEPACVELLAILELPEADRATLIGALYRSDRGREMAELLADVEADPDDLVRRRRSRGCERCSVAPSRPRSGSAPRLPQHPDAPWLYGVTTWSW